MTGFQHPQRAGKDARGAKLFLRGSPARHGVRYICTMRLDVVIVGAGIGGAVLALDLGRRGWRVALVERENAPPRIARPEVLWGATLRALEP